MDLKDRQHLYNGFGNGLARAIELALTPLVFGFLGHLLDSWLGTNPVFTALLVVFALAGISARMYYGYDTEMKQHESSGPWARKPQKPSA